MCYTTVKLYTQLSCRVMHPALIICICVVKNKQTKKPAPPKKTWLKFDCHWSDHHTAGHISVESQFHTTNHSQTDAALVMELWRIDGKWQGRTFRCGVTTVLDVLCAAAEWLCRSGRLVSQLIIQILYQTAAYSAAEKWRVCLHGALIFTDGNNSGIVMNGAAV